MSVTSAQDPWKFPTVKTVISSPGQPAKGSSQAKTTYYGAYFYPFASPGVDPVFAIVGGLETIIARPHPTKGIEIIRYFIDDDEFIEQLCTACWTKDQATGDPLLAVGGQAGIIKILCIKTGKVVQTLSGHGDEIMEILISPVNQTLIASASADSTVRIWSIDPKHKSQPCALVCAGEGHRETILSIAFHASGRYLLSGGMDHIVNLWVLPDVPDASTGTDKPIMVMYPHFSTSMVHSNYIDCLAFYGDYILSKAAREYKIVFWSIQNFTSKSPPPPPEQAPTTHEWRETRSAFGGSFERLLQFSTPDTEPFFMRFGFFLKPDLHPVLAMGSTTGKVYLWDLARIEACGKGGGGGTSAVAMAGAMVPPPVRDATPSDRGSPAVAGSGGVGGGSGGGGGVGGGKGSVKWKEDDVSDPFGSVKAHYTLEVPKVKSPVRHVGWSMGGEYMLLVGEDAMITICRRW